jgi:hypothetical protein
MHSAYITDVADLENEFFQAPDQPDYCLMEIS